MNPREDTYVCEFHHLLRNFIIVSYKWHWKWEKGSEVFCTNVEKWLLRIAGENFLYKERQTLERGSTDNLPASSAEVKGRKGSIAIVRLFVSLTVTITQKISSADDNFSNAISERLN